MASFTLCAAPAKAGLQLEFLRLPDASINYFGLPNWAPASAGVGET